MESSRQEYQSGLPFPPPGHLLDPGIEPESPVSPALQADSLTAEPPVSPKPFLRMLKKKKKRNSPFQITIEGKQKKLQTSNKSIKCDKRQNISV